MLPFPILPPIPGPIKDALSNLGDFANPFAWAAKAFRGVYNLLAWYFEFIIAHPPRFGSRGVADYLYGNAIGLAGMLIFLVTVVLLCVSIFRVQKFVSVVEAVVIGVVISVAGPLVFGTLDTLIDIGDRLSHALMFYHPKGHEGLIGFALDTSNPMLPLLAFSFTGFLGGANVFLVYVYEALNVLLRIIILPAFALRPLGNKPKVFSDWTISIAVVTMALGRPVMILCIELGRWAGDTVFGGSAAGTVFFLCAGFALSLYMQFRLIKETQNVVARISKSVGSKVWGRVDTTQKNKSKVDVASVNNRHANTMKPVPVTVTKRQAVRKSAASYVKHETKRAIAQKVATKAAATAAGASSGGLTIAASTAVATAAKSAAKRAETRRDRPS